MESRAAEASRDFLITGEARRTQSFGLLLSLKSWILDLKDIFLLSQSLQSFLIFYYHFFIHQGPREVSRGIINPS